MRQLLNNVPAEHLTEDEVSTARQLSDFMHDLSGELQDHVDPEAEAYDSDESEGSDSDHTASDLELELKVASAREEANGEQLKAYAEAAERECSSLRQASFLQDVCTVIKSRC